MKVIDKQQCFACSKITSFPRLQIIIIAMNCHEPRWRSHIHTNSSTLLDNKNKKQMKICKQALTYPIHVEWQNHEESFYSNRFTSVHEVAFAFRWCHHSPDLHWLVAIIQQWHCYVVDIERKDVAKYPTHQFNMIKLVHNIRFWIWEIMAEVNDKKHALRF